ncbi:hypothetical protein Trydic_g6308 [Trypoxylus dichotomus]
MHAPPGSTTTGAHVHPFTSSGVAAFYNRLVNSPPARNTVSKRAQPFCHAVRDLELNARRRKRLATSGTSLASARERAGHVPAEESITAEIVPRTRALFPILVDSPAQRKNKGISVLVAMMVGYSEYIEAVL